MSDEEEEEESIMDSPHTGAADRLKESKRLQAQQLLGKTRQSPRFAQKGQQPTPPSTAKRALPLAKKKAATATATASKKRKEATAGKPPLAKKANKKKGATKVKQEIEIPKTKQPR